MKKSADTEGETSERALRRARTDLRKTTKALRTLSNELLVFFHEYDSVMRQPASEARGKAAATLLNRLEMRNDAIRYGVLGVDFRTDDKAAAVQNIKASSQ